MEEYQYSDICISHGGKGNLFLSNYFDSSRQQQGTISRLDILTSQSLQGFSPCLEKRKNSLFSLHTIPNHPYLIPV